MDQKQYKESLYNKNQEHLWKFRDQKKERISKKKIQDSLKIN